MELFASSNFPRCDYYPYLPILIRISRQCTSKGENTLFPPFVMSSKLFFVHFPFVLAFSLSKSFPRIIFGRWQIGYLGANARINLIRKRIRDTERKLFFTFPDSDKHFCHPWAEAIPHTNLYQSSNNGWSFFEAKMRIFRKITTRVSSSGTFSSSDEMCQIYNILRSFTPFSKSVFAYNVTRELFAATYTFCRYDMIPLNICSTSLNKIILLDKKLWQPNEH